MNEISGRMDEVTELATDWAQNSDPSSSQHLTNEITSLSERFGSVSTRLIKKEKELEDILVKWQRFESSCADLQAWIENQRAVLNESVTVDVSLTLQLQQLATCQVRTVQMNEKQSSFQFIVKLNFELLWLSFTVELYN